MPEGERAVDDQPDRVVVSNIDDSLETYRRVLTVDNPGLAPQCRRTIPLGRFGQPSDSTTCVLFIASNDASDVAGQSIVIDGDRSLGIPDDREPAAEAMGLGRN